MSPTATAISFSIILPAELPDKTVLACLVMARRYRPGYVFAGAAAAFTVQVALAVTAGGLLELLPHRPMQLIVGVLLLAAAVLLWRRTRHDAGGDLGQEAGKGFWPVALTAFAVVFAAEFGDLTQIVTAGLAARYHDPVAVGIGSGLALWAAAGLAVIGGRSLLKVIPLVWVTRGTALVMLAFAGASIATAVI